MNFTMALSVCVCVCVGGGVSILSAVSLRMDNPLFILIFNYYNISLENVIISIGHYSIGHDSNNQLFTQSF